jgi:hypothetical protein
MASIPVLEPVRLTAQESADLCTPAVIDVARL